MGWEEQSQCYGSDWFIYLPDEDQSSFINKENVTFEIIKSLWKDRSSEKSKG